MRLADRMTSIGTESALEAAARARASRSLVADGLNATPGFGCLRPAGAFCAVPETSGTGLTGTELADLLLNDAGASVPARTAFGTVATNHIRLVDEIIVHDPPGVR